MLDSCRVCLNKEAPLRKTSTLINNITYNEELAFCIPEIDWTPNDSTPSLICPSCTEQLERSANFRRLCLQSDAIRKTYMKHSASPEDESKFKQEFISSVDVKEDDFADDFSVGSETEDIKEEIVRPAEDAVVSKTRSKRRFVDNSCRVEDPLFVNVSDSEIKQESGLTSKVAREQDTKEFYVPSRKDRTCVFCKLTFSKYTTLANHVRSIHTFEKRFKCETCGEGFTNSEILSRHKNRHTGERKYVCSYCGKKFFTNSDLNHHVQRHLNKRSYKCDVCPNKSFNTANSLRSHRMVVHSDPEMWKFLCTICGRKCVTQASLNIHMKRHTNEKNFSCHLCEKRFCTKAELTKHILSHSNMRLHKCEVCNQEYKDRKIMEMHLSKKHGIGDVKVVERVKKFCCDVCPKKFVGKRQLEKHLRSHTGERPFKCDLCEQTFICSSYIKGHMRTKHMVD